MRNKNKGRLVWEPRSKRHSLREDLSSLYIHLQMPILQVRKQQHLGRKSRVRCKSNHIVQRIQANFTTTKNNRKRSNSKPNASTPLHVNVPSALLCIHIYFPAAAPPRRFGLLRPGLFFWLEAFWSVPSMNLNSSSILLESNPPIGFLSRPVPAASALCPT
jgi:hypothetical protein